MLTKCLFAIALNFAPAVFVVSLCETVFTLQTVKNTNINNIIVKIDSHCNIWYIFGTYCKKQFYEYFKTTKRSIFNANHAKN
jgi:hypothetical protein